MNCNLTLKDKSIQALKKVGATEDLRRIVDEEKFHDFNKRATERAYSKYGVGDGKTTMLFSIDYGSYNDIERRSVFVKRAKPDAKMFEMLQDAWDNRTVFRQIESETYDPVKDFEAFMDLHTLNDKSKDPSLPPAANKEETSNEVLLFGESKKEVYSVNDILDNISLEVKEMFPADWLDNLISVIAKNLSTKVEIVDSSISPDAVMYYDSAENKIIVPLDSLNSVSNEKAAMTFLHEAVHAFTVNMYNNPQTMQAEIFKSQMDQAFAYYMENSENSNLYGFSSVYEFMAELVANPLFKQELQSIDGKSKKNLFKTILEYISRVMGFSGKTLPTAESTLSSILNYGLEQEISDDSVSIESLDFNSNLFFAVKDSKEDNKMFTDLSTIEGRLEKTNIALEKSIKAQIRRFGAIAATTKSTKFKNSVEKQRNELKVLLDTIAEETVVDQAKAFTSFLKHALSASSYISNRTDELLRDKDSTDEQFLKYFSKNIENNAEYLDSLSVVEDIASILEDVDLTGSGEFKNEDLEALRKSVKLIRANTLGINDKLLKLKRAALSKRLNNIKYFPKVESKYRDKATALWRDLGKKGSKEDFITNKLLNEYKADIQKDLDKTLNEFLNSPTFDVASLSKLFNSPLNIAHPMVQVMNQVFMEMENERLTTERKRDLKFKLLFNKLSKEKGSTALSKLYENILDYDHNGVPFLKSEYKAEALEYYSEIYKATKELNKEMEEVDAILAKNAGNKTSKKYQEALNKKASINSKIKEKTVPIQKKYYTFKNNKPNTLRATFKNDLSKLSETEKEVLAFFKEIATKGSGFFGQSGLIKNLKVDFRDKKVHASFYKLPAVSKSQLERAFDGQIKELATNKLRNLSEDWADDVQYTNQTIDFRGNIVRDLKLKYRGSSSFKMDARDQSLDLFTIFRMEDKNQNAFKIRLKHKSELDFMLDVSKDSYFYGMEGSSEVVDSTNKKLQVYKNDQSNLYQLMTHLMESKFYDMTTKGRIKWGKYDVYKAIGLVNSANAFLTMSLNIASGTANVLNGSAQLFLESFFKGHFIKAKSIAKAQAIYTKDTFNILQDTQQGIDTSFVNQLNEMFDLEGSFNFSEADFLKSNYAKAHLNSSAFQAMQSSGEHWLRSVTAMSILDGIKVKNKAHKFINKEGKVTKEEDAASLLDMLSIGENGLLELDKKVDFTTHSRLTKWNEGGKTKVDALVHKKLYDISGNYRAKDQPEVQRHALGKLGMMYRRYLVPMGVARFRGISTSLKDREEIPDHKLHYSYALQEYEQGSYTALVRYLIGSFKQKKLAAFSKNWNKMSDYERHATRKAIIELVVANALLPIASMFAGAAADDADDEILFFLAYQLRRLETELKAYHSIGESFKILRSPIPSARIIENSAQILQQTLSPWSWGETYDTGRLKDKNKFLTKVGKQIPGVKDYLRSYQDLYNYQNRSMF